MSLLSPRETLIALNLIPGLGSMRIQSLLNHFGAAELVLEAPAKLLAQVPRIGPKLAAAIADWRNCTNVQAEQECAAAHGVRITTLLDDEYPTVLRRMSDPPIVLYSKGHWYEEDALHSVAIVGTRQATAYGITQARRFACELADHGCCIISGLARGIDTAGHLGALDAGGRTIAVLGGGLCGLFPPENSELAERILHGNHGALISEFPMNMPPSRTTFPQRNRIVAAWSRAILVVEAPPRSGSLHTAKLGTEHYGACTFAIPGPIHQLTSCGCHALIRDGATLCSHPRELIADMGWETHERQLELFESEDTTPTHGQAPGGNRRATDTDRTSHKAPPHPGTQADTHTSSPPPCRSTSLPELLPSQRSIVDAIRQGFDTLDQLCPALGLSASELAPELMKLLISHHLTTLPGARYRIASPELPR